MSKEIPNIENKSRTEKIKEESDETRFEKQSKNSALFNAKFELDGIKQLGYKFVEIGGGNYLRPCLDPEKYPDEKRAGTNIVELNEEAVAEAIIKNPEWQKRYNERVEMEEGELVSTLNKLPREFVAEYINGGQSYSSYRLYRFSDPEKGGVILSEGHQPYVIRTRSKAELEEKWKELKEETDILMAYSDRHSQAHQYGIQHKVSQEEAEKVLFGKPVEELNIDELGLK